jgi:MFS family permease
MQQRQSMIGLACGGLLAMAVAIGIGRFVYTPILPVMLESLAWSKAEAGLVASSNFLGYLIGALLATRPITASRQRRGLIAALLVSATRPLAWPFADGDIDALSLWAGQSAALVRKIQPAAEIVREIDSEADAILLRLARRRLRS